MVGPKVFRVKQRNSNGKPTLEYELKFRSNLAVIIGNSGTGKTLLVQLVKQGVAQGTQIMKAIDEDSKPTDLIHELKVCKQKVILFDNCELYLTKEELDYIIQDKSRYYMLFARNLGDLAISPNLFGEIVRHKTPDGYKFGIAYKFSLEGWYA